MLQLKCRTAARLLTTLYTMFLVGPVLAQELPSPGEAARRAMIAVRVNVDPSAASKQKGAKNRPFTVKQVRTSRWHKLATRTKGTHQTHNYSLGQPGTQSFTSQPNIKHNSPIPLQNMKENAKQALSLNGTDYIDTSAGVVVKNPTGVGNEDANLHTLAALREIFGGEIDRAIALLEVGTLQAADPQSSRELLESILSLDGAVNPDHTINHAAIRNYGFLQVYTPSDEDAVWVDGMGVDGHGPCGVIAATGRHTVRISSSSNESVEYTIDLKPNTRSIINVSLENGKRTIYAGGNDFFTKREYVISAGDNRTMTVDAPAGTVYFDVVPPVNTAFEVDVRRKDDPTWVRKDSLGSWIIITSDRTTSYTVRIKCISGGGVFKVYDGMGLRPDK